MSIREAVSADVPAMLAIYAEYVTQTAVSFEYEVPSEAEFTRRLTEHTAVYPWLVWEEDGRVLGYCYAGRAFERAAYAWNAEISCYLAHEAQHRGIGRQLYARVEELLRRQGCRKVFAIVTSANELSLAFHRAIGYRDAACFRQVGYKFGRWYDVTWLEKSLCPLGEPSEFPISWKEVL